MNSPSASLPLSRDASDVDDRKHTTMMLSNSRAALRRGLTTTTRCQVITNNSGVVRAASSEGMVRWLSNDGGNNKDSDEKPEDAVSASSNSIPFVPRRRSNPNYRPVEPKQPKVIGKIDPNTLPSETLLAANPIMLGENEGDDELERNFGPLAADAIRHSQQKHFNREEVESRFLRMADYMSSKHGTTEHYVSERKALAMDLWQGEDRAKMLQELDDLVEEERVRQLELGDDDMEPINEEDQEDEVPINQLVHGDWAESIIQVDRVQKVQRGGTMVRYRALLIGGNGQGVAGFGVGKAHSPSEATTAASRHCKRNIFFIDRHLNRGLTRDLVGKHNSCKVVLRATPPNFGLKGHDLVNEILIFLGVTDCSNKTHGNRNPYNVVRATFKAIMTHESMEEVALKRGKRLLNLERVKRLQI